MPTFPTLKAEIAFHSGYSVSLDGSDDYVVKASPTGIPSGGSARTIEAWIKPANVDPGGTVLGYGGASGQTFNVQTFRTGGSTYLFTDGVNVGNNITLTGTEIPTAGVWNHVAFVLSSSTAWEYFLNGVSKKSGTFPIAINSAVPTAIRIGNRTDANQNFPGQIDEVRVWNTARTGTQIAANKDVSLVGNESGLVAYWKFNEGTGTNANDETANNNDGTLTNGATWSTHTPFLTWTDVSDYLLPTISTKRGRQRELDKFQPGTFSFVLTNEDRRFDPTNTSSPYYPNVIPNRRCRITAVDPSTGIDEPLIDGYIDSWPPSWKVSTATVTVTATDGMKLLSRADMPEIFYVGEVLNDAPTAYYRLNETDNGHPMADASGFSRNGVYKGNPTMGRVDPITDGVDGAVDFNSGATRDYAEAPQDGTYSGTGGFSVEFWVFTSTATGLATMVCWESSVQAGITISIGSGLLTFRTANDSGAASQITSTSTINNNAWRHIVCVRETDGTLRIYIDGNLHRSAAATIRDIPKQPIFLGAGYAGGAPFNGWLDEVAIYPSALTATRVAAHYAARNSGLNDTTGARVGRVLDFANWPTSDRTIDTGQSTLQSETTLGSAADEISKATDSEFGAFYISRDGKARFRERHAILKSPYTTPQLTLADDGTGHMYSNPELDYSDLEIRNDVTIQRTGGRPQTAKDDTSIEKYGLSSYSKTGLSNTSDNELRDAANSILQKYKEPFLQVTSITLEPHAEDTDGTMWTQVLSRELEDRVRVKATPPGGGAIIDKEMHIQGISHQIGPGPRWITKWDLSQAEAVTGFWILGTGALDEDTALAF